MKVTNASSTRLIYRSTPVALGRPLVLPAAKPTVCSQRRSLSSRLQYFTCQRFQLASQRVVQVSSATDAPLSSDSFGATVDITVNEAKGLRRLGWVSFWSQLALSLVSGIVLFFTASSGPQGGFPAPPVFFNLAGVAMGFISTFLAFGKTRIARSIIEQGKKISKSNVSANVLQSTRLNLLGLGATIIGLQAAVGGLVGKALTSSSAGAYSIRNAANSPAALDVFAVQALTNTILLHYIAILFANWTQRLLNKDSPTPAAAK